VNFKYIKNFNINKIKKIVASFNDEWEIDTSRQKTFDAHSATKTYNIYNADIATWKPGMPYETKLSCKNKKLLKYVNEIVFDLENMHDGRVGQCILTSLDSGAEIPYHVDKGEYLVVSKRHHIPIITTDNVFFFIDSDLSVMREGECWEIRNIRPHRVINAGNIDRIHLIVDIIPNRYIGFLNA
jgi:aspartyl/asparaginyl beta-hydroxylase (cupin superfamily)